MLITAAFLLGGLGTAALMSHRLPAPSSSAPTLKTAPDVSSQPPPDNGLITIEPAALRNAGIRVKLAALSPMPEAITVPGTVEANPSRVAKITPPVPGKVTHLFVGRGDQVRTGQPLAVLDSTDVAQVRAAVRDAGLGVGQAQAGVQTARAQVGQAQAKRENAQITLDRQRKLAQAGAFSQAPLQAAQSELSQAQSELAQAQTDLQTQTAAAQRAQRLYQSLIVSKSELEQAQAQRSQSQARVAQATTRVALAKQSLAREQTVSGGDLLSKQAVQTAEADLRSAQADVQTALGGEQVAQTALNTARGRVGAARSNLYALGGGGNTEGEGGQITLRAPFTGIVTDLFTSLGETVERSTALLAISNTTTVLVQANVSEQGVARVRVGQPVQVTVAAYPGTSFPGVVQSLGSRVDDKTRTLPVRCLVENRDGRLKPSMFASVALTTEKTRQALAVPSSAIDEDGAQRFVYVAKEGGYERRAVQVGRTAKSQAQILSGLRPGERVAVAGVFVLKSESKKSGMKGDTD